MISPVTARVSAPFTPEELWSVMEPHQIARLHLARLEREGKRPSAGALAHVAGVSLQCAKRQLRWHRQRRTAKGPCGG